MTPSRLAFRGTLMLAGVLACVLAPMASSAELPDPLQPSTPISEYRFSYYYGGANQLMVWRGPEHVRWIVREGRGVTTMALDWNTVTQGTGFPTALRNASIESGGLAIVPDAFTDTDLSPGIPMNSAATALAAVRAGTAYVTNRTVDGRAVMRIGGVQPIGGCDSSARRTAIVDVDAGTLLPTRYAERSRGRLVLVLTSRISRLRPVDRRPIRFVGRVRRDVASDGASRPTLAEAAAQLGFSVPTLDLIPGGFRRTYTGWTRNGSIPSGDGAATSSGAFATRWSRGWETLELTARRDTSQKVDWTAWDPLGGCASPGAPSVNVGASTARYVADIGEVPHIWWRDGDMLYTLAGAYSAEQLATMARTIRMIDAG